MAAPLTPTQLRRVASRLAARGFTVKFYPGWETRGRPYTWGPVHGFNWHHTGSDAQSDDYLYFLFVSGRASEGIPGPLCQFAVRSNGEIWIGAAGRANQAGKGSSSTLSKLKNSAAPYTSEIDPGPDDTDGNAITYGAEIMYSGGHAMSTAQYRASIALAAEMDRELGWTAQRNIGHREWSGRKWDPGAHKLYTMRQDTRTAIAGGTTAEEEDMTEAEFIALMKEAAARNTDRGRELSNALVDIVGADSLGWGSPILDPGVRSWAAERGWDPNSVAPRRMLDLIMAHAIDSRDAQVASVLPALTALKAQLDALQTVDIEALSQAIVDRLPAISGATVDEVDAVVRGALADIQIGFPPDPQ